MYNWRCKKPVICELHRCERIPLGKIHDPRSGSATSSSPHLPGIPSSRWSTRTRPPEIRPAPSYRHSCRIEPSRPDLPGVNPARLTGGSCGPRSPPTGTSAPCSHRLCRSEPAPRQRRRSASQGSHRKGRGPERTGRPGLLESLRGSRPPMRRGLGSHKKRPSMYLGPRYVTSRRFKGPPALSR
jgi:hypothetical protein